jgi:hypothetical protein
LPNVANLQGRPVSATAPANTDILGWSGSAWEPVAKPVGTVTSVTVAAGTGLGVTSPTVTGSGTITVNLGSNLAALNGVSGTGIIERTGTDTFGAVAATTAGKNLLTAADLSAQKTLLGISSAVNYSGGGPLVGRLPMYSAVDGKSIGDSTIYQDGSAKIGFGTSSPSSALDVKSGSITGTFNNAGAVATLDMSMGNIQAVNPSSPPGTLTLNNLQSGAAYTVAIQSTNSGSTVVSAPGFTVKCRPDCPIVHDGTPHDTVLTVVVAGTTAYVTWIRDF